MSDIFLIKQGDDIDNEVEALFKYWRIKGFPNYDRTEYNANKILSNLIKFNENSLWEGNEIRQAMLGCGFLWTYFPHWINVTYNGGTESVASCWNDDEKLRALIKKTYRWQQKFGRGVFTVNRLRQNAKIYCSKQSVSNFRPTVAKLIYNTYGNGGKVWDMSGGYGGRLLGFLSSNCTSYTATDPCTETVNGLNDLYDTYKDLTDKEVKIIKSGSEDYLPEKESLDLCFTSPPYFNTEMYSNENTQSYMKFDSKQVWLDDFLGKTMQNCWYGLKPGRYMIINIANVSSFKDLEQETIRKAQEIGFVLEDTKYMVLSSVSGNGKKFEPIFIFKKLEEISKK